VVLQTVTAGPDALRVTCVNAVSWILSYAFVPHISHVQRLLLLPVLLVAAISWLWPPCQGSRSDRRGLALTRWARASSDSATVSVLAACPK
jgi:hypothetical protein